MFLLPTFDATLRPCPVGPAEFMPHAQGSYCGHCQRVVQDFSQSRNPVADLAAARAASPDGRVCGSFRRIQVAAPPTLTRRMKWFVLALVLVVGQGLTAQEALAQVHTARPPRSSRLAGKLQANPRPEPVVVMGSDVVTGIIAPPPSRAGLPPDTSAADMPTWRGGGIPEIVAAIQQQVVWPQKNGKRLRREGQVLVSFVVGTDGRAHEARIVEGLHPLFDEAVLAAVQGLAGFTPGQQNGRPVDASLLLPITFKLK
jgi:TonB family protein